MKLWTTRFDYTLKEIMKYGRYIINDHSSIFLFIVLGASAVAYQGWLQSVSKQFPWAFFVSVLISIPISYHPFFSMLKKADLSFLAPREGEMTDYFNSCIWLSIFIQFLMVGVVFLVLTPIIHLFASPRKSEWAGIVVMLILLKLWSFYIHFQRGKLLLLKKGIGNFIPFIAFLGSFLAFYILLMKGFGAVTYATLFIIGGLTSILYTIGMNGTIPWVYWVEKEEARWSFFYRIASLSTNVPQVKSRMKPRKIWGFLLFNKLKLQEDVCEYQYSRTWLRSGEYFSIFLRLIGVYLFVSWFFHLQILSIGLGCAVVILYGLQIMGLHQHHQYDIWEEILPIMKQTKKEAFLRFLQKQLFMFASVVSFISLLIHSNLLMFTIEYLGMLLTSVIFVRFYGRKKVYSIISFK